MTGSGNDGKARARNEITHHLVPLERAKGVVDGDASVWVVGMGRLVGLFDNDWLGIPATGKMTFLRYAEFR